MDTPAGLSCRLEAAGHAGYAPAGQDIVCAGASTVMQGLVYLLAGEENAHSEAFDEPDGPRLAVSVDAPCEEWVRGAFELAKACFVLLAERYPENVRFADVSRRGKESMMDLQLFAAEATAACGGNREPRLGPRSDFSKPCQGAAEKSANATRCCCLARGFQHVGMSTVEAVNRKISWLFCFVSHGCTAAERVRLISRRFKTEKMEFHIDKTSRQVYNRT